MSPKKQKFSREQTYAALIAMKVRNAMEDFHAKHLSDDQMRELNPIIRNAIYETLLLFAHAGRDEDGGPNAAQEMLEWLYRMIPSYWEPPLESKVFREQVLKKNLTFRKYLKTRPEKPT